MSARGRHEKLEKNEEVSQHSGASRHRTKEGRIRKQAEGNARRARATHGRKVSSNSGALKRRRKREEGGNETLGKEDEEKEERRGMKTARRSTATSRKVEKRETTRP